MLSNGGSLQLLMVIHAPYEYIDGDPEQVEASEYLQNRRIIHLALKTLLLHETCQSWN